LKQNDFPEIYLYSKPIVKEETNLHIFFAEFSFSKHKHMELNERFFCIVNLIATVLIVTNENNLSESCLKSFILATTIKDNLIVEGENRKDSSSEISFYFAELIWVLRNPKYTIKSREGKVLNAIQYLKYFLQK
jgi:hypothetical protein